MSNETHTYEVRWIGDPAYGGRDSWDDAWDNGVTIETIGADDAASEVFAAWAADRPGSYGEGTVIAVREIVPLPPVRTYVVDAAGRVRYESPATRPSVRTGDSA